MSNSTTTPKNTKKTNKEVMQEARNRLMSMIAWRAGYYRFNPQRFVKDYLGIELRLFQKILIFIMMHFNHVIYFAARGQGKTFLTALFVCVRAILFPGSKIIIAAPTLKQGGEVLLKIQNELCEKSLNLRYEIQDITIGQNKSECNFKNGSWAKVVTASDNSRGFRANVLIIDEFVKVDLNIITMVLKKFMTASREPKFYSKKEYKDYPRERNKEIAMSSAWLKSHWSYDRLKSYVLKMTQEDKFNFFVCGLPYQLSVKEGLLSYEDVYDEMTSADFSEQQWELEMGCLFYGDINGAFFKYEDVESRRVLQHAIYPPELKLTKIPPLAKGERRILSCDVALLASRKHDNDASSIWINSSLPSGDERIANFIYTENHEGILTSDLALRVRQLFEVYHCTDIVLDAAGVGQGVLDALMLPILDPATGKTYEPLNVCNDPDLATRCKDRQAKKVIWAIKANPTFNQQMYLMLRNGFLNGKINLLIPETEAGNVYNGITGYKNMEASRKAKVHAPYAHTTMLVQELISMEHDEKSDKIKLFEKSGMRKDRVSSVGYNFWVQMEIQRKKKPREDVNSSKLVDKLPIRKSKRRSIFD